MKTVLCPNCQTTLNLPADFQGGAIQCPSCRKKFRVSASSNAVDGTAQKKSRSPKSSSTIQSKPSVASADELFNDDILKQVTGVTKSGMPTPTQRPPASTIVGSHAEIQRPGLSKESARPDVHEHKSTGDSGGTLTPPPPPAPKAAAEHSIEESLSLGEADPQTMQFRKQFGFKRFWTPAIIRVTWWCVVGLSVLWFLYVAVFYAGSWLTGQSPTDSIAGLLPQGMNLQDVLSGNADPDSLNKMLDGLDGNGGAAQPQLSGFQKAGTYLLGILSFVTMLASLVLTVLWCRVFFESIVAVFEIAARLKRIDEKTR